MRKVNLIFDRGLYIGTAITSISFFLIIIIAITSRYILKAPILASIEISRLLFVWSCFLAAAIGYRRKAHVAITFVYDKFPASVRKWLRFIIYIVILLFSAVILYQSIVIVKLFWQTKLPMLQISQSWFYLPLPVVFIFIISYTLEFISNEFASTEV